MKECFPVIDGLQTLAALFELVVLMQMFSLVDILNKRSDAFHSTWNNTGWFVSASASFASSTTQKLISFFEALTDACFFFI